MAITYDAPSDVITVTGGTEGTPLTWEDIYQADQSGGWGQVSKQGDIEYLIEANLRIGASGSTTWFADADGCMVQIGTSTVPKWLSIGISQNEDTHFRLGEDGTPPKKGGYLRVYYPSGDFHWSGDIKIYGATVELVGFRYWYLGWYAGSTTTIKYSTILKTPYIYRLQTWERTNVYGYFRYPQYVDSNSEFTDLRIEGATYGTFAGGADNVTLKNCYFRPTTYIAILWSNFAGNLYLVNPDTSTWNFYMPYSCTGKVHRQYEFDLRVSDKDDDSINGATVTLKDKDGNTVFSVTTDANGDITTQTVGRGYYDQAHGDSLQDYSPHTLTIEKAGYQTYEKKFTLEEKTAWEIKLAKAVGVFLDLGRPVINLKKSNPENKNVMVL